MGIHVMARHGVDTTVTEETHPTCIHNIAVQSGTSNATVATSNVSMLSTRVYTLNVEICLG